MVCLFNGKLWLKRGNKYWCVLQPAWTLNMCVYWINIAIWGYTDILIQIYIIFISIASGICHFFVLQTFKALSFSFLKYPLDCQAQFSYCAVEHEKLFLLSHCTPGPIRQPLRSPSLTPVPALEQLSHYFLEVTFLASSLEYFKKVVKIELRDKLLWCKNFWNP